VPDWKDEAKQRLDMLTEFGVDIYLHPEREVRVGQEKIPLWIRDYGYSQRGIFTGGHRSPRMGRLYLEFRDSLIRGESLKPNA